MHGGLPHALVALVRQYIGALPELVQAAIDVTHGLLAKLVRTLRRDTLPHTHEGAGEAHEKVLGHVCPYTLTLAIYAPRSAPPCGHVLSFY